MGQAADFESKAERDAYRKSVLKAAWQARVRGTCAHTARIRPGRVRASGGRVGRRSGAHAPRARDGVWALNPPAHETKRASEYTLARGARRKERGSGT